MEFKRKVARNRGNARVWIEGKKLTQLGWSNGKRFNSVFNAANVPLTLSPSGERKVAGNPERPIIDINTAKLNSIIGNGTHYVVKVSEDCETVTITSFKE